jgi:hypothetical protein
MATFSLGTSGVTPGAPGVYINEQAGLVGSAAIADFSTVYMTVETEETVPVTLFPYNTPTPITSLADYQVLCGGFVPEARIPLLSYNCVNEFFQNAQVGDLRVVRVGTPNQIVEISFLASGSKVNATDLPSALKAGDRVYIQMVLNGNRLVAGDGSTGYTSTGEWLGVPVIIPVNYVAGDEVNNRKITSAIATAVSSAIESNPSIRSSVYVRNFGLVNDLDPLSNSDAGFITIAATTFDGSVSVVTQVLPVGSEYVFSDSTYEISNIVGQQNNLVRVPQDYIQCINTAFDGQQDQGYLITPTAYAQFDAAGRSAVGAAAAAHCADNNFKWLALADCGPYLVTNVNRYSLYTPHQPAADLIQGNSYLVDNAIYKWIGESVSYDRANYQELVAGSSAETAVTESKNECPVDTRLGLLDNAVYANTSVSNGADGIVELDGANVWPVSLQVQEVVLSEADDVSNPFHAYNGEVVYVVAAPYDLAVTGEYPTNFVFLAETAAAASSVLQQVISLGGTSNVTTLPTGAIAFGAGAGTCSLTYEASAWDLQVNINGQTSDLIENNSDSNQFFNTLHLPGTLQKPTNTYRLGFVSRTIFDPSAVITDAGSGDFAGAAVFEVVGHGLSSGQKVMFTQAITAGSTTIVKATRKGVINVYYVTPISPDSFALSVNATQYSTKGYVKFPSTGAIQTNPSIFYTPVSGGGVTAVSLGELTSVPFIRGRKYAMNSGTLPTQSASAEDAPTASATNPGLSVYLNNSAVSLDKAQISPWGETTEAGWLPALEAIDPGDDVPTEANNFYCVPTVEQNYLSEAYLVPAIDPILGGLYNPTGTATKGPIATLGAVTGGTGYTNGTYSNVALTGGTGNGATADITVAGGIVTVVTLKDKGFGYTAGNSLSAPTSIIGSGTLFAVAVGTITAGAGILSAATPYALAAGLVNGSGKADIQGQITKLLGVYFNVITANGFAPDGTTEVSVGDRIAVVQEGTTYLWRVIKPDTEGGYLPSAGQVLFGSSVEIIYTSEQAPAAALWNFDAITSIEIINDALRGVGFNGDPQASFVEAGVDNVNRLYDDSQRYFNPFGFIAFYGSNVLNASGQYIPPSPYVTGVAVRRYRAEGYQFPPAGVKYQLTDAVGVQIPINSAQQNLLNPKGCNAIRTLPGYPQTAVFIWGGRTRVNADDAQQALYKFVNTRVIMNVVYGSLRKAFDSQIFNIIDGFGVIYNQIIAIGNSVLNQLYVKGALFGQRPSDAFQVVCDERINTAENLENGIVNAKVFVTPVPTLERIQIDLIRVAIGNMQKELNIQGLGQ